MAERDWIKEVAAILDACRPVERGYYVLYVNERRIVLSTAKNISKDTVIVARLSGWMINNGLTCNSWERIGKTCRRLEKEGKL